MSRARTSTVTRVSHLAGSGRASEVRQVQLELLHCRTVILGDLGAGTH